MKFILAQRKEIEMNAVGYVRASSADGNIERQRAEVTSSVLNLLRKKGVAVVYLDGADLGAGSK